MCKVMAADMSIDARTIVDRWRDHYNREKPHSSLGYQPPVLFAEREA
jgi:putative transposase